MKSALIFGAGGFIGSHMARRLKREGFWVRGVDLKKPEYSETVCDDFVVGDLCQVELVSTSILNPNDDQVFDQIYQYAADMGGAGFIFTGDNDAEIMRNSATINLHLLNEQKKLNDIRKVNKTKIFYSSSACVYPEYRQEDPDNPDCRESSAYPAAPDSEYGWEKLFSERLFLAFNKNHKIPVAIARFHNIFGPEGTWDGGREKAPAAICRKVALASNGGEIEIWGDGKQTRSFLYIDECIEATYRFMNESEFTGPMNIGSEEMVTINKLVEIASQVENKVIKIKHIPGPLGVRGRNSNNDLVRRELNWDYQMPLRDGIEKTYKWIASQIELSKSKK